jgi:hypothetical protein
VTGALALFHKVFPYYKGEVDCFKFLFSGGSTMKTKLTIFILGLLCAFTMFTSSYAFSAKLSRDANYEKALNWIKDNNKWGRNAPVVTEFTKEIESAIGKNKAIWEIGWGMTKSGKSYRIEWTAYDLVITPYSRDRTEKLGYKAFSTNCTIK